MKIDAPTPSALPTATVATAPPFDWIQWSSSPIAEVRHDASAATIWHESWLPSVQTNTGRMVPSLTPGGASLDDAINAAHHIARTPVRVSTDADGVPAIDVNPAIAVMRAPDNSFWLAPLLTSMRTGNVWHEVPHTIDGAAFAGNDPLVRGTTIRAASPDLVAVVGRDTVLEPAPWPNAPR